MELSTKIFKLMEGGELIETVDSDGNVVMQVREKRSPQTDEEISDAVAQMLGAIHGKDFPVPGELLVAAGHLPQEHFDLMKVAVQGSEGIERQEIEGQAELMEGTDWPLDCDLSDEQLIRLGFKLGDKVDDIFRECKLPDGWEIVPTSHSMWNDVLDENGHKRAAMFYKAAFYDRSSHVYFVSRYHTEQMYEGDTEETSYKARKRLPTYYVVKDRQTDQVVFKSSVVTPDDGDEPWDIQAVIEPEAKLWLESEKPLYQDAMAYWD